MKTKLAFTLLAMTAISLNLHAATSALPAPLPNFMDQADQPNLIVDSPSQMVCKVIQDPKTKVIFYLESDRHHLSAISPKGTLLWQIDTWSDAWSDYSNETIKSKEERKSADLINFIELYKPEKWFAINETGWSGLHLGNKEDFLSVSLNDRVFGLIKKSNGEFIFVIQN